MALPQQAACRRTGIHRICILRHPLRQPCRPSIAVVLLRPGDAGAALVRLGRSSGEALGLSRIRFRVRPDSPPSHGCYNAGSIIRPPPMSAAARQACEYLTRDTTAPTPLARGTAILPPQSSARPLSFAGGGRPRTTMGGGGIDAAPSFFGAAIAALHAGTRAGRFHSPPFRSTMPARRRKKRQQGGRR